MFQAEVGVPGATNTLDTDTAELGALRDRIAEEYVSMSAATGTAVRSDAPVIARLRSAAVTLVAQESRDQVALADATDQAGTVRSHQLSLRHWKETAVRGGASLVSYLLLAAITAAAAVWAKTATRWRLVLGCAAGLLAAFLIADIATWVAGLALLFVVVTLLIRERTGPEHELAGD